MLHAARWKRRTQNIAKMPSAHHRTTLSGDIFATKSRIDNRKKLLNSNIFSRCFDNIANSGPLTDDMGCRVWSTSANFKRFRVLALLLQQPRSPEGDQTLHDAWPSPRLVHYLYIFSNFFAPDGILPGANFTLRPSLAFSYIGNITARHSTSGHQPNFAGWYKEWN